MQSSGLGHMVGVNDAISRRDIKPVDILSVQADDKDKEVATLQGLIKILRSENTSAEKAEAKLRAQDQQRIDEVQTELDTKISNMQRDLQEQLASFKKEAAIKVKTVRKEEDKTAKQQIDAKLEEEKSFADNVNNQLASTNARISELQSRVTTANQQAEAVYKQTREAWKQKRHTELEAKGVSNQVSQMESEISTLKAKRESLLEQELKLKEQLKSEAREKILMAARLKNLHHREESLKGAEAKYAKDNENLKHQVEEVKLTQLENAPSIALAREEIQKKSIEVVEEAKSKAETAERSFEKSTLTGAKSEIAKLKIKIHKKEDRESNMEVQMLQQEHNVQAEKKEADDDLAKAEFEAKRANKQIELELKETHEKSRWLVDEARRKAAKFREDARVAGMKFAENDIQKKKTEEEMRGLELVQEEKEMKDLSQQFREHNEKQRREFEDAGKTKEKMAEEQLKLRIEREEHEALAQLQVSLTNEKQHVTGVTQTLNQHIVSAEQDMTTLSKQNQDLHHEIASLKDAITHQREELTAKSLGQ